MNQQSAWYFRQNRKSGISFFSSGLQKFSPRFLLLFILIAYVPFLGGRVVRPAGDDKVYVSQAIEMAQSGSWFLQTLGGEPNYYKGPLHYILLRVGMFLFGFSMWATVYMNLISVIIGAVCLGKLVARHQTQGFGWPFFAGLAFALNAGIYSHVFASQMEVELAGIFLLALYYLDLSGPGKPDRNFWIVAGIAGWIKSPLHAVFLGVTAILFWAWQGELWSRCKSLQAWASAILGILVCSLGYLPAFALDGTNFLATYVHRETLDKPANGAPWHYPIIPLFTFSLLPWMLPAFVSYLDGITRLLKLRKGEVLEAGCLRMIRLGVSLMLPCILFFLWHPYRGQNYDLPVIGGLLLITVALISSSGKTPWRKAYSWSFGITGALVLLVPLCVSTLASRFSPTPFWWPSWLMPLLWLFSYFGARGFWKEGVEFQMARADSLARRSVWVFVSLGFILTVVGERELIDLNDRIYQGKKGGEKLEFGYYNLQKNIWCEWGYLNFMVPTSHFYGIYSEKGLTDAVAKKDVILVPGQDWLDKMKTQLEPVYPGARWEVVPWRRWKTKGKNAEGVPAWKQAWDSRNLTLLEKDFFMVRIFPAHS